MSSCGSDDWDEDALVTFELGVVCTKSRQETPLDRAIQE
jgi:hypothetical protein